MTNEAMAQVAQISKAVWQVIKPWAERNVTFSLLLAVLTEVPRWTFAFRAVNEPLWAGIPLAILIAFAAAHAWEEYFAEHDKLLLALNVVSLVFAVFTIAPVLYAMIDTPSHDVSIAAIFPTAIQWMWASVLACTTFLPLIQLAVVEARRRDRAQVLHVTPQHDWAPYMWTSLPSLSLPLAMGELAQPANSQGEFNEADEFVSDDLAQGVAEEIPQPQVAQVVQAATVLRATRRATTQQDNQDLAKLRKVAQGLRSKGKTLDEIAAQVGRSTTWVSRNTQTIAA